MDEAAYLSRKLYTEALIPLLQVMHSVVMLISSPGNEETFFEKFKTVQNPLTGEHMFEVLQRELICLACKLTGVETCCIHNRVNMPSWISAGRQSMLRVLMESDPALFDQEIMGIQNKEVKAVFEETQVRALETKTVPFEDIDPSVVFISVDPSGGGSASHTAIISLAFTKERRPVFAMQIVGLDSMRLKGTGPDVSAEDPEFAFVKKHVLALRSRFGIHSLFVTIVEGQFSVFVADNISKAMATVPGGPMVHMREHPNHDDSAAIVSTHELKLRYVQTLQDLMRGSLAAVAHPICTIEGMNSKHSPFTMLCQQLRAYEQVKPTRRRMDGGVSVRYSGKNNGPDDLVSTLQQNLFYSFLFMSHNKYAALRRMYGLRSWVVNAMSYWKKG